MTTSRLTGHIERPYIRPSSTRPDKNFNIKVRI